MALVNELTGYFSGKYSGERLEALDSFVSGIPSEYHPKIREYIIENRQLQSAIGVSDIKQACLAIGVPFRAAAIHAPKHLDCVCCGRGYKFLPAVNEYQQLEEGIHCRCPDCGFPGSDQLYLERTAEVTQERPPALDRYIAHFSKMTESVYNNGRGGAYWNAHSEREAIAKHRREAFGIVDGLAKAKAIPA